MFCGDCKHLKRDVPNGINYPYAHCDICNKPKGVTSYPCDEFEIIK